MANPPVFYLFVYGSLRSGFHSPAYEYISHHFDLVEEGKVKGRLYDMGEYPAAIPVTDDSFITGELYLSKNEEQFDWALGQLDDYEGVLTEPGEPQLYRRELADIYLSGRTITAWIYWYNGDVTGRPEIHSGDILEYLKNNQAGK